MPSIKELKEQLSLQKEIMELNSKRTKKYKEAVKETERLNKEIKTQPPKPPQIDIPILDIPVPVPTPEVLVTAVTTAVAAVATTTLAQPLFDTIKKKVQKFLQGKINKWKQKREKKKDSSAN